MANRISYTAEDDAELIRLYRAKASWKEMGAAFGRHPESIRSHLIFLKVHKPKRNKKQGVERIKRVCNRCDQEFWSAGYRICPDCHDHNARLDAAEHVTRIPFGGW
jgi:Zn finger protein HypA/HybF involved in hydrogenase expression